MKVRVYVMASGMYETGWRGGNRRDGEVRVGRDAAVQKIGLVNGVKEAADSHRE
jgi:hypothetical protein